MTPGVAKRLLNELLPRLQKDLDQGLSVTWPDCGCRSPKELSACLKTAAATADDQYLKSLMALYEELLRAVERRGAS